MIYFFIDLKIFNGFFLKVSEVVVINVGQKMKDTYLHLHIVVAIGEILYRNWRCHDKHVHKISKLFGRLDSVKS